MIKRYKVTVSGVISFQIPDEQDSVDCLAGKPSPDDRIELALTELTECAQHVTVEFSEVL